MEISTVLVFFAMTKEPSVPYHRKKILWWHFSPQNGLFWSLNCNGGVIINFSVLPFSTTILQWTIPMEPLIVPHQCNILCSPFLIQLTDLFILSTIFLWLIYWGFTIIEIFSLWHVGLVESIKLIVIKLNGYDQGANIFESVQMIIVGGVGVTLKTVFFLAYF